MSAKEHLEVRCCCGWVAYLLPAREDGLFDEPQPKLCNSCGSEISPRLQTADEIGPDILVFDCLSPSGIDDICATKIIE